MTDAEVIIELLTALEAVVDTLGDAEIEAARDAIAHAKEHISQASAPSA